MVSFELAGGVPAVRQLVGSLRLFSLAESLGGVESLVAHRERETIIAGLWVMTGYRQLPVAVDKGSRGRSTYSLWRKITAFVNAVTSFSDRPLVYIFYLGTVIVFVATIAALRLIARQIFYGINAVGWPSLIVSIWLLGGLTIFCLGLIGIYLSKVFIETKNRPSTGRS